MDPNTFLKRVVIFAGQVIPALLIYWLLRNSGFHDLTAPEAEGLNTLILLIGSIYAVMYAFVIFVIWGQFIDVENFVMRECNSLNDVLRFSRFINPDSARRIRHDLTSYVDCVLQSEWNLLADRQRDPETERKFVALVNSVIQGVPATPDESAMHERLIDIARRAGEHRDERITRSLTRIPPTLIHLVNTMAIALLLLVFLYPFHHWVAGFACFVLVAFVLFLANTVMLDTDNPFRGIHNVSSQPFSDLLQQPR